MITLAIAAVAAVVAAWWAVWLMVGLLRWLVGLFTSEEAPQPRPTPEPPPPQWMVELQHIGLWDHLYGSVTGYAHQHAAAAGMPPLLLLSGWALIGAILLAGCYMDRTEARVAWWVWLAATAWVVWSHTPTGSPVPAALTAALGVTASAVPWSVFPIAALIAVGVFT